MMHFCGRVLPILCALVLSQNHGTRAATTVAPVAPVAPAAPTAGSATIPTALGDDVSTDSGNGTSANTTTTSMPLNTTTMATTTRAPPKHIPFYFQPLVMASVGVIFLVGGGISCLFCWKACLASAFPKTARRCDHYCEHDCCNCKSIGPICGKCLSCCCPDDKKKKKKKRRRKKKQEEDNGEGQWWAYYPGIGWGLAPANMAPEGGGAHDAEQGGNYGGTAATEWNAGYDYEKQNWAEGGAGMMHPTMAMPSVDPYNSSFDPNYDYQRMESSRT